MLQGLLVYGDYYKAKALVLSKNGRWTRFHSSLVLESERRTKAMGPNTNVQAAKVQKCTLFICKVQAVPFPLHCAADIFYRFKRCRGLYVLLHPSTCAAFA